MIIVKKNYEHKIADEFKIEVTINRKVDYNLFIVYYINCLLNENYFTWIENQLSFVNSYKGNIYLMCSIEEGKEEEIKNRVKNCFPNTNIIIEFDTKIKSEYIGLKKVWDLSQQNFNENDIIMYFHSKGISRHKNYNKELISFLKNGCQNCEEIMKDINYIYEILNLFPSIDKITATTGDFGWGWYNFWVARGSYLCKVEEPIITLRRHYYEDWLGRKIISKQKANELDNDLSEKYENSLKNCYQLYCEKNTGNIGFYMPPPHLWNFNVKIFEIKTLVPGKKFDFENYTWI